MSGKETSKETLVQNHFGGLLLAVCLKILKLGFEVKKLPKLALASSTAVMAKYFPRSLGSFRIVDGHKSISCGCLCLFNYLFARYLRFGMLISLWCSYL